ncbi:NAD-glutamate dehydrogenase [Skermanella stibiiresistens SB22]|uniref:NAD-glutamate dehydrogenase n=1 Tax=Skermanella stibiiresistens SB22 TaxID=1385369 RepID=W9H712_9PROT|nr:NAD-glutamate dehydrogenase [Skermanella stibiiresistens]EWY40487.1 NAD-glutamate dehydrogenase [Skermanella stibiiresistens SB22]
MALKAEQLKGELTEQIVSRVRDRLNRDRADLAERFIRQFYANVPPDDLLESSPDQLYCAALSIWQFAAQRPERSARVRAYHPQLDEHGWQSGHTVVEIVNDDMPFLVDSVTAELNRQGLTVHLVIHPVVRVRRDSTGRLVELYEPQAAPADATAESFMHIEVDEQTDPLALERIAEGVDKVLSDVRAAVEDWQAMRAPMLRIMDGVDSMPHALPETEMNEARDFLLWLNDDNFTFLGYRRYRFEGEGDEARLSPIPGEGLGVLRDDDVRVFDGLRNFAALPPDAQQFLRQPRLLLVTKSNRRSTVHRPTLMDSVFIKAYDEAGQVVGEHLFVGLFTSVAYSTSVREIPYLRNKAARVLERARFEPRSHDGKALTHILENFPRDELFQITDDELFEIAIGVLHLQERQRTALFVRRDPFERFITCLVYVPRDRYDTDLRRRIQAILERTFNGTCSAFFTQLAESVLARVQFVIETKPGTIPDYDVGEVEERLIEASRAWPDRLQDALVDAKGEEDGLRLHRRYANAFDVGYRDRSGAELAVYDIERIEEVIHTGRLGLNLYRPIEAAESELNLKLYHDGKQVPLSDILPMLEHMGVKVISEGGPFEVRLPGRIEPVWIHDFAMTTRAGVAVDLGRVRQAFQDTFLRVWEGGMEDDGFNRLVIRAGLGWREITVLRAYAKYLRQIRFQFSQDYMEDTLADHAAITRLIVKLFQTLHDPDKRRDPGQEQTSASIDDIPVAVNGLLVEIDHALDGVANLDEDRILRRFLNLVRSTLRTNYYQKAADGGVKPYVSMKLDSRGVDELPLPRPMVEVWVYSPRVEAIHLRGGKVARGGIRWSDRREDFRTEILGLMKAQMVKNAVIVPVGSKGGFVVKRPPPADAGRDVLMAEVIECYKTLMRGLLDITDNFAADGSVVPPPRVVRLDSDDPYLVVAADKGTATFSDIANGVSQEYGFWLDDAFASGGSRGYDHKKMGITARGAWESVKRHFREIGVDCQTQDFTCVGVGDMAGDVFGNGMLLSRHTCLVGAFNHLHIFCDPNPDPAASFEERRRLFDLPRSTWADYDAGLLSRGGAIFDRKAKSLKLSPEIQARFGLTRDKVTPAELIQAMLRSETDLLWFGGIGTFIKATEETHAEVGDKANDATRIDGREIRAKIVGEGANLGVTQRGRIEYAQAGGRINTDAIDNSAGVDTSDHEVNIKVLTGDVIARGDMTMKQRDQVLASMTDEVADLVLSDNYLQTQAISVAGMGGADLLEGQVRFMRQLEKSGHLNRPIEFLPDDEEISSRTARGQALTRPELAVLLAYSKITLYDELLASNLPDDPRMAEDLAKYFPKALRRDYRDAIERHRLRREIIATYTTNSMVNRVGPTFVSEMMEKTGMGPGDIARAYTVSRDAFALRGIWTSIEALDNAVPAACQYEMIIATQALLQRTIPWFLINAPQPLDIGVEAAGHTPGVEELAADLDTVLSEEDRVLLAGRTERWVNQGVPEDLARKVASLGTLASALDVNRIARLCRRGVPVVARIYFDLGHRFGMEWLRSQAVGIKTENHWQKQAVNAIIDDLYGLQSDLTARILNDAEDAETAIDTWVAGRQGPVDRIRQLLTELRGVTRVDLAMLAVANRQLRGLIAS